MLPLNLTSTKLLCAISLVGVFAACANSNGIGTGGTGGSGGELTGANGSSATHASSSHATTAVTTVASTTVSTASSTASTGAGGPMCTDPGPGEPNDTMTTAFGLPGITDCDSDGTLVKGILGEGGNDVDWYKYAGSDTTGCTVDPSRQLIGAGLRICKYIDCSNGKAPSFTCPQGTIDDTQGGHPGCCWTGGLAVTLNLTCGSTFLGSDDSTVYMRVDHPGGLGCESYQINYHY